MRVGRGTIENASTTEHVSTASSTASSTTSSTGWSSARVDRFADLCEPALPSLPAAVGGALAIVAARIGASAVVGSDRGAYAEHGNTLAALVGFGFGSEVGLGLGLGLG